MKLLAFALSLQTGSYNRKLIKLAVDIVQQSSKIEIDLLDLLQYEMPPYNKECPKDYLIRFYRFLDL